MKQILAALLLFLSAFTLQAQKQFKALLITKTAGWHHESINDGVEAIRDLADRNFFEVQWHQDAVKINDKYLQDFQVLIFLNTTGNIFDSSEQKAIERFIQSGKGYVGIHSAADTEYDWDWYNRLVGRMFFIHPAIQTAKLQLTNTAFPGLQNFSINPLWTDEWYQFGEEKIKGLNYILSVDETTYNPEANWSPSKSGKGMGSFHPVAWYHDFDGGRSFYTALGHLPAVYRDPAFLQHIYAGIFWAATGKK
ncbi:MAG: ThuA domain-containing protein [Chitinophagaceae bacterium]